jgi:plastocyanin domain-containing protein
LDEIVLHKTTALMLVGLALAVLLGAYIVFSTPGAGVPTGSAGKGGETGNTTADAQEIYIKALSSGSYDKQEVTVKKGIPVRLHFTADPNAGCGRQLVIYGMNVRAVSKNGEESVVEFTPQQEGTYEYNCGMRMWQPGRLVVQ